MLVAHSKSFNQFKWRLMRKKKKKNNFGGLLQPSRWATLTTPSPVRIPVGQSLKLWVPSEGPFISGSISSYWYQVRQCKPLVFVCLLIACFVLLSNYSILATMQPIWNMFSSILTDTCWDTSTRTWGFERVEQTGTSSSWVEMPLSLISILRFSVTVLFELPKPLNMGECFVVILCLWSNKPGMFLVLDQEPCFCLYIRASGKIMDQPSMQKIGRSHSSQCPSFFKEAYRPQASKPQIIKGLQRHGHTSPYIY